MSVTTCPPYSVEKKMKSGPSILYWSLTVGDAERGLARRIAGCSMTIFNAKTRPRLKHQGRIHAPGEVIALRRGRHLKSNMLSAEAVRRTPTHHVRPILHTRILTRYFRLKQ